jgi:four helix bundle protein
MKLEELIVYQSAMKIGDDVWGIVSKWDYFAKSTVGQQLVRGSDSIAANISEGYGRYHFNENRHFIMIARGSLSESKTWIQKATNRNLLDSEVGNTLLTELDKLGVRLNNYLNSIGPKTDKNDQ